MLPGLQGTNAHVLLQASSSSGVQVSPAVHQDQHWQRQRFWLLPPPSLLAQRGSASRQRIRVESRLSQPKLAFMFDHRVRGAVLLPGAGMLEAAAAAARAALVDAATAAGSRALLALAAIGIHAPLVLQGPGAQQVLACTVDLEAGSLQLTSSSSTGSSQMLHLTASCAAAAAVLPARAAAAGAALSPAWLQQVCKMSAATAAAAPGLPSTHPAVACMPGMPAGGSFCLHPAQLDNTFQLGAAHAASQQPRQSQARGPQQLLVPAAVDALLVPAQPDAADADASSWAQAAAVQLDGGGSSRTSASLWSLSGQQLLCVVGLLARELQRPLAGRRGAKAAPAAAPVAEDMLYQAVLMADTTAEPGTPWQAQAMQGGTAFKPAALATAAAGAPAPSAALGTFLGLAQGLVGAAGSSRGFQVSAHLGLGAGLLQPAPAAGAAGADPQLPAMLAGMLRSIGQELPSWQLDLATSAHDASTRVWAGSSCTLPRVGVHGSHIAAGVLHSVCLLPAQAPASGLQNMQLVPSPRGSFGSLVPVPVSAAELGAGQVALAVKALGLNFRQATCFVHLLLVLLAAA